MAEDKSTPRPWTMDEVRTDCGRAFRIGAGEMLRAGKGCCIIYDDFGHGDNERKANAALIVSAVNQRAALMQCAEALSEMVTHAYALAGTPLHAAKRKALAALSALEQAQEAPQ